MTWQAMETVFWFYATAASAGVVVLGVQMWRWRGVTPMRLRVRSRRWDEMPFRHPPD